MISYRIVAVIGGSIAVLAVLVAVLPHVVAPSDINPESIKSPVNPVSTERPIYTIWGNDTQVHDDNDASSLVGYSVKFPTKLPASYSLQLAGMKPLLPDHKYVYLFYSKSPISNTMQLHDFWHVGGIMIRYDYEKNWTQDPFYGNWTNVINGEKTAGYPDAHGIVINGYAGWAGSNHTDNLGGWPIQRPSVVQYDVKGVDVQLIGGIPLGELTFMAESMQY